MYIKKIELTGFTAPKILWVQEHEPEIWKRASHILLPKDYVRYKLTGEFASDRAGGAGTILFDLAKRDWSPEVLVALNIPASTCPIPTKGRRSLVRCRLRWHRDTFAPNTDYDTLLKPAADIPPGSDRLLFLPYLTGERTPHPDPLARSAFVGLTVRHKFPHLTRSVLEGVAFGLRDSFELIKSVGLENISQVNVTGGGARSPLWRQILADVLQTEIVTVNTTEGAAYGAALLAAVGTGVFRSVESACDATIQVTGTTEPGANQSVYDDLYPLYDELYPALRPTFNAVAP